MRQPFFGPGLWPFLGALAVIFGVNYLVWEWRRAPPAADPLCLRTSGPCRPVDDDPLKLRSLEAGNRPPSGAAHE